METQDAVSLAVFQNYRSEIDLYQSHKSSKDSLPTCTCKTTTIQAKISRNGVTTCPLVPELKGRLSEAKSKHYPF